MAFDHDDRCPDVLGQRLQVPAAGDGERDERVPGRVELPRPDAETAEGRVPRPLREDLDVDGPTLRVEEQEAVILNVERLLVAKGGDHEGHQLDRPVAAEPWGRSAPLGALPVDRVPTSLDAANAPGRPYADAVSREVILGRKLFYRA